MILPISSVTIQLFEQSSPSVVQVVAQRAESAQLGQDFESEGSPEIGTGTGFLWDAAGMFITNAHVLSGAGRVAIRTAAGAIINATIVGTAPNYDLAVVRIQGPGLAARSLADRHIMPI